MGDRSLVRILKSEIANQIKRTPIFRDHICRTAENTFSCPICEIRKYIDLYPLAALSVLRHFHFFDEAYLPQESDLFDLLGPDKVNRMIEEEQRRMFGSVYVICRNCSHKISFFNTYQQNLDRHQGTNFSFMCTKCGAENNVSLFKEEDLIKNKLHKAKKPRRTLLRPRRDDARVQAAEPLTGRRTINDEPEDEPERPTTENVEYRVRAAQREVQNTSFATTTVSFTQGGNIINE